MEPIPKDRSDMAPTYMLLKDAEGAIQAGPEQQARLNEVTERLSAGEFHVATDGEIPYGCIDGRDTREGLLPKPDSAGGSETLFVASDLTKDPSEPEQSTGEGFAQTLAVITEAGYQVGGHTDEHASGEGSGCGANDKLGLIYDFISRSGEKLRALATQLGVEVSDEAFERIIENAGKRASFDSGRTLLDHLREHGDETADLLTGDHKEVAAVINLRKGTTLDRVALKAEFGEDYESFNVDAWTFDKAADIIAVDAEDKQAKILAMTFYNLATAHVLCGPEMRVVVLQ